ncbi:MAG: YggS family pyridoxal phosphate-dependent enzyme [Polyangiaceae bacterium]|nr:YggS family pyridoxal phosphate-dependent enzyme [Polyangiaceae bacterium]
MNDISNVTSGLQTVRTRISKALALAGRGPNDVQLIAVSKKQPVELIREAYALGQRDFGENYVQELLGKAEACADLPGIRWHMIGHLQRNKARHTVAVASAVHTVDSVALAEELGKRRSIEESLPRSDIASELPAGIGGDPSLLSVLVEVNVGGELQKSGCTPSELPEILDAIEGQPSLELVGLMTVPPLTDSPEGARAYFDQLAELRQKSGGSERLPHLSMGMTADLEQAILAGSTLVRVGTAIFGSRL